MEGSEASAREALSTEKAFEEERLPAWSEQITVRSVVLSSALGLFLSFIVMKLNLTSGIVPSLKMSAGLLAFFLMKTWTSALERCGVFPKPFSRQENTVVQTCVISCSSIAFSGGFGTYILSMSKKIAVDEAKTSINVEEPSLGRIIAFLFLVSFVGLFSIVPLRKIMIISYKLTYQTCLPSDFDSFHAWSPIDGFRLFLPRLIFSKYYTGSAPDSMCMSEV
ncbi:probable metal-nicotianamine transporter YSL8 [Miscanthus floridulus]|uniref:probable metal-nicotianamine transporter YSL8 n=1 Tax=Miscanthus floridulus TaxID=154761 RepID=UPI00345A1F0B